MPRPLQVFLCHASQDKPAVWRLRRYLKQHGVQPWLDQADLLPGEDWQAEIPKAIDASDVILVCLSKNSVNKEGMVQKEITFALDKAQEKPEGTIFVIPVRLEECDAPKRLNRYQWVDLFRPDGNKRLLMGLNKRAIGLGPDVMEVLMPDATRPKPTRKPILSDQVNGNKAAEKTEPEKLVEAMERADYEAMERAELQQAIREADENAARQKVERESKDKAEREVAEKAARERNERETAEKEAAELAARVSAERDEVKPIPKKPYTRLLDPSSLSPQAISSPKSNEPSEKKSVKSNNLSLLSIGGIILLVLILGGFGLNYLIKNLPIATALALSPTPTQMATSKPATSTNTPSTPTPQPIETVIPTPTLGIGSTMISEKDGMTLLYVPAGESTMGSDTGSDDEKPAHSVYLDFFWIDETEVTNEMYAKCVNADKCNLPSSTDFFSDSSYGDFPVIYVSWNDATAYCAWVGGRLPTEAEWEKAASWDESNQVKRIYPWGNDIDCSFANYLDGTQYCVGNITHVKSYLSGISPYGAYNMAGNVWEWVADFYDSGYYQNSPSSNPKGPDSGQSRVLRGGAWLTNDNDLHSTNRYGINPTYSNYVVGFRCARDTTP